MDDLIKVLLIIILLCLALPYSSLKLIELMNKLSTKKEVVK